MLFAVNFVDMSLLNWTNGLVANRDGDKLDRVFLPWIRGIEIPQPVKECTVVFVLLLHRLYFNTFKGTRAQTEELRDELLKIWNPE
jgi:hypothetical protein